MGLVQDDMHFEGGCPEPEAIRVRVEELLGKPVELIWQPPGFWVFVNDRSSNDSARIGISQRGNTLELEFREGSREPELLRRALLALGGRCEPLGPPRPFWAFWRERRFHFHFMGDPPTPKALCEQVERSGGSCTSVSAWPDKYWLRDGANGIPAELRFVDSKRIIIESSFGVIMPTVVAALKSLGGRSKYDSSPKP